MLGSKCREGGSFRLKPRLLNSIPSLVMKVELTSLFIKLMEKWIGFLKHWKSQSTLVSVCQEAHDTGTVFCLISSTNFLQFLQGRDDC